MYCALRLRVLNGCESAGGVPGAIPLYFLRFVLDRYDTKSGCNFEQQLGRINEHALSARWGAAAMFRACYGLLVVKEMGRWKSSCLHGYLRYDVQTMRHFGGKMAVATGLLGYTKIKSSATRVVTFRASGKKHVSPQPQLSLPSKCAIPVRDVSGNLTNDVRKSIHLRRLIDNPEKTEMADLLNFDNSNDVFYARQGRLFVKELLALGDFHLARNVVRSHNRRNKNVSRELPVVEFNRLHRDLERYRYGDPVPDSEPFRVGPRYRQPTQ